MIAAAVLPQAVMGTGACDSYKGLPSMFCLVEFQLGVKGGPTHLLHRDHRPREGLSRLTLGPLEVEQSSRLIAAWYRELS